MTTRRGRSLAVVGITGLVALAGCSGSETISESPGPAPVDLGDVRLISYDSCDGLLDWFHQEAAARVSAYGLEAENGYPVATRGMAEAASGSTSDSAASAPTTAAPSAGPDDQSSTTNTQEPGVGEPDLAWTDGTRLVTVVTGQLRVVDLEAGTVTATLDLPDATSGSTPVGLLVEGDHAVVVQRSYGVIAYDATVRGDVASSMPVSSTSGTRLTRIDLGASPAIVGSITVDGDYVDARMVDGVVRAVVRSSPAQLGFVYPSGNSQAAIDRATAANRQVIAESTIDDWLPTMTVEAEGREGTTARAVDCSAVDHPTAFGGFGVVTVVGLDLGAGAVDPLPSAAVVADAQTVYASTDSLYLATTRWPSYGMPSGGDTTTTTASPEEQQLRTDVHAFSLPADATARYEASGSVPGQLLGQFALSEHEGDLRVATTTTPTAWAEPSVPMAIEDGVGTVEPVAPTTQPTVSESRITVLRHDGDALTPVGEVTGLGPTEQIRGVRFAGPTAYVVTFRQTDPLFVVDLSDPTAPKVAGQLKIPGYSSYLQEIGDGRVLGIGQDATSTGRQTGFQESLFDVSDPSSPQRLAQLVVPYGQSLAESDHHALLWWAPDSLLAVPVTNYGSPTTDSNATAGVLVTRVTDGGIEALGTITHPASGGYGGNGGSTPACPPNAECLLPMAPDSYTYPTQIDRTLVANGRLVTVSTAGVKISDMATLADQAWIPFT
jgi:uncharacterized secreted protein with C-terminal beta-propeller domain